MFLYEFAINSLLLADVFFLTAKEGYYAVDFYREKLSLLKHIFSFISGNMYSLTIVIIINNCITKGIRNTITIYQKTPHTSNYYTLTQNKN